MTKLELEIHDDVISTINKIKNINDDGIELEIPEGSVLFESGLNLMLLRKEAEDIGKVLHFSTNDISGQNLITSITEPQEGNTMDENYPEVLPVEQPIIPKTKKKLSVPFRIKMPNLSSFKFKTPLIAAVVALLLFSGIYAFAYNTPKAEIKITLDSQPLTKSVSIKAKKDATSDPETKILRGIGVSADTTETQSIDTTGTKMVGEKATGKVTIYNFTDTDKTLKKNTSLTSNDLKFLLDDEVTIDAAVEGTDAEGEPVLIPGKENATVTADAIGEESNISKDKTLTVKGYKTSEVKATSSESFKGGESKEVKIVDAKDLTDLSSKTLALNQEASQTALTSKIGLGQKLINGSSNSVVSSENFDAKVGDEKDKLTLTQTVTNTGLAYSTDELNKILDSLVKSFIPEGYVLSTKDREVSVEVLGNSDTTVLNPTEADLQVTLKTFVIPNIQTDKLKEELLGKKLAEAEVILGKVRNIKTYEINISKSLPFLQTVPRKPENVNIEVVTNDEN